MTLPRRAVQAKASCQRPSSVMIRSAAASLGPASRPASVTPEDGNAQLRTQPLGTLTLQPLEQLGGRP
jgi:hypothetical protein